MQPSLTARFTLALVLALTLVGSAACGSATGGPSAVTAPGAGPPRPGAPSAVVTTSILGAVVADLVGDAATVRVVMPNGVDPHDFRPSARDVEAVEHADVVVANGLHLDEGLADVLDQAQTRGTPVFVAADHVTLRTGGQDPHLWTDPIAMREVVAALTPMLSEQLGADLSGRSEDLQARLVALDARVRATLAVVPPERRLLVTGHESLGWFADRYDLRLVGTLIPNTTSQAAPSAGQLAALEHQLRELGVPAIFTEVGTSRVVAASMHEDTGVRVVELRTHSLPDDGSYESFVLGLAEPIAEALRPPATGDPS